MGETILKIKLDELNTVRVTCQKCQTVVEVTTDSLTARFHDAKCKHCGNQFFPPNIEDHAFIELEHALLAFKNAASKLQIEFVYHTDQ